MSNETKAAATEKEETIGNDDKEQIGTFGEFVWKVLVGSNSSMDNQPPSPFPTASSDSDKGTATEPITIDTSTLNDNSSESFLENTIGIISNFFSPPPSTIANYIPATTSTATVTADILPTANDNNSAEKEEEMLKIKLNAGKYQDETVLDNELANQVTVPASRFVYQHS
jgi:hypothetical protein